MSEDYYRFLVRTISTVGHDPAQLRKIIYNFTRSKLRKELWGRKDLKWPQIKLQMVALEKAIEQVESDIADHTMFFPAFSSEPPPAPPQNAITKSDGTELVVREDFGVLERALDQFEPETYDRHTIVETRVESIPTFKPVLSAFWSTARLVLAVVLGVALFFGIENRGDLRNLLLQRGPNGVASARPIVDGHVSQTAMHVASRTPPAPLTVRALESIPGSDLQAPNFPVPNAYGVYALSHGKLTNLQTLPIRVPDERVGISALFSTPSESTLPDGRLQFIAFRRDLANDAPDRVMARVVARVMRALTFDATGHAKLVNVESSWAVRSNNYEMQVAPVSGNPEMIRIRPQNPNFIFPAGRYALVLQGSAYDFTVAGQITDTAQCLERTDALNMPVYTECSNL